MPHKFKEFLERGHLRAHFFWAMGFGFLLRSTSAFFVYGPQALDDYKHGVWPAYQYLSHLPLNDFPSYRSHLLVWVLAAFARAGGVVGISSAIGQVRLMYFGLGLISLLAIVGTYLYARVQPTRLVGRLMLYMIAAYPLIPFVSTRAFGEAVALSFVTLGFGALEFARLKRPKTFSWWAFGFLSLGVGVLFRFQVGVLFIVYSILMATRGTAVLASLGAGLFTLITQALIDLRSDKIPLGTLVNYLQENEGGAAKYGVSPWYNTWVLALALMCVPFSLVLYRHGKELWRRQWPLLISWLAFVFAHGLVAHKEERFLYPILGLEIWALAFLWARGANEIWVKRIFAPFYLGLTAIGLIAGCFINSQEGEIGPPALIESRYKNIIYLDAHSLFGESRFQFYFLRGLSEIQNISGVDLDADHVDKALTPGRDAVALLTSDAENKSRLEKLEDQQTEHTHCGRVRSAQSMIDRLLFKLNPRHNQRRRPTWYLVCERTTDV